MSSLRATQMDIAALGQDVQRVFDGIDQAWLYSLPLNVRFRGVTQREGLLLRGEHGWGEAAPFAEYDAREASNWLASALLSAKVVPVKVVRDSVPVNVTIPVVSPEEAIRRVHASGGCTSAKVKVADPRSSLVEDCARVEAVAEALRELSPDQARVRVDVNGAWDVDEALRAIPALNRAAHGVGGLEYVEQPCMRVEDLAEVRRRCDVRIAADESIRRAEDPLRVVALEAADVAVVKVSPLGGWQRTLSIAAETGLDVVVSSALESSVGLSAGVWAAAAVPHLPFACGLATMQILGEDVTSSPLEVVDGRIALSTVVPDRLTEVDSVPAERVAWWGAHLKQMCSYL